MPKPTDTTYLIIDLETTGLSYTNDDIIEIGAIRLHPDGHTDTFSQFIKPKKPVPPFIYQLTKISENDIKKADDPKKVLTALHAFINPDDIIVCHNTDFDINFLRYNFDKKINKDLSNHTLDTLSLCRIFTPFLKSHSLDNMTQYFQIDLPHAHRAIYDAQATATLLTKLTEFILEYVLPHDISFILTVLEYAKNQKKHSIFARNKDINDYLLPYIKNIHDEILKNAMKKSPSKENPYNTHLSHHLVGSGTKNATEYTINDVFAQDGAFSKTFENYEHRTGQIDMSNEVLAALETDQYLLVEAGTGVGKSLAYLVSGLLYSKKTGKRIVVSTNTKNLQEQLLFKDIPLLAQTLQLEFTASLVKGRENYLCLRKWNELINSFRLKQANINLSNNEIIALLYLYMWATHTPTGDIAENHSFADSDASYFFKKVSSDRHLCFHRKCAHFDKCFLQNARQKAEKANILIINHSLLFSIFQSEQATFGDIEYLVIDEAHNLIHSAAEYLGFSLSYAEISGFLNSIYVAKKEHISGMVLNLKTATIKSAIPENDKNSLVRTIDELLGYMDLGKACIEKPFRTAGEIVRQKGSYQKFRIKAGDTDTRWVAPITEMQENLKKISLFLRSIKESVMLHEAKHFVDQAIYLDFLEKSIERMNLYITHCDDIIEPDLENNAFWLNNMDTRTDDYPDGIFNIATIQVNEILPDLIYRRVKSLICTSATLSLRGSFKYFSTALGFDRIRPDNTFGFEPKIVNEKIVPSPFNYHTQTKIINTAYLPDPADQYYPLQAIKLLTEILTEKPTGTLVLFTANKDIKLMYEYLIQTCFEKGILLLAQGITGSRTNILNQFKEDGKAVLLGTSSFWEGIDVPGDSLKLLIMYKLPFQVPSEPIIEAYLEKLEKQGKNSFMYYSVPNALLKMKQGIGRLIRSKTDKGVILILDNRVSRKQYGQYFREILPTTLHSTGNPVETLDIVIEGLE